jgi:isopentenyldiphosphate isomerase
MEFCNASDKEMLKIFDKDKNYIGNATREDVHRLGHWHEAFHCWFISRDEDKYYIYLQLRSAIKKDYPNLLDITAAGHILSHETIMDGIREIHEEIGILVSHEELELLGIIDYCVEKENFIDKEIAHTYLYEYKQAFSDFVLQQEEVSGIFKTEFNEFYDLWTGRLDTIKLTGIIQHGEGSISEIVVGREHFVPHYESFYQTIVDLIRHKIVSYS